MNINKNSWHFKFNLWFKSNNMWKMPKTLCGYFWTTVLHIVMVVTIVGFICAICWMLGLPILTETSFFTALIAGLSGLVINILAIPVGAIIYAVFISAIVGIVIGIGNTVYKFKESRRIKRYDRMVKRIEAGLPPEEHNVFWNFIKARKEKVCPLIDYVEGEKK